MTSKVLVNKLNELISLGKDAMEHEVREPRNIPGVAVLTYPVVNGPSFSKFTADTKTLLDRHLKGHELYPSIHGALYSKQYGMPSTVKKVLGYLESIVRDEEFLTEFDRAKNKNTTTNNKKVFIVHGHDIAARDTVEQLLWRIGLIPVIMMNEASRGLTLIEKLEANTDVGFAIILYTACDVGRDKKARKNNLRARQNVVFEHGYLMNKLGRDHVVALVDDEVETPGDLSGLVYVSLNDNEWKKELMRELKAAGFSFDFTKA